MVARQNRLSELRTQARDQAARSNVHSDLQAMRRCHRIETFKQAVGHTVADVFNILFIIYELFIWGKGFLIMSA